MINDRVFLFLFFITPHHLFFVNPYYLTDALVITVIEDDVEAQAQEQGRGSLSDQALAKLLEKLEVYQP